MTGHVIEIGGHTKHQVGKQLSNFQARPFTIDAVRCGGMEGFLQGLKCPDVAQQKRICALSGIEAKRAGRKFDSWKDSQMLYFLGCSYHRSSRGYMLLVSRAYDELYMQDDTLKEHLLALGDAQIWHSIGNPDMRDTTLTEVEMMYQIERLRHKAFVEDLKSMTTIRS